MGFEDVYGRFFTDDANCEGVNTRMEERKSKINTCGGWSAVDGSCELPNRTTIQKKWERATRAILGTALWWLSWWPKVFRERDLALRQWKMHILREKGHGLL